MKNFTKHRKIVFFILATLFSTTVTTLQAGINTVFSENFNGFSVGTLAVPGGSQVLTSTKPSLDDCTQTTGWQGQRVYQAGGAVKLGAAGQMGYIATPFINLLPSEGRFYVKFKAMGAQAGDSAIIRIATNKGLGMVVHYQMDIKPYDSEDLVLQQYGPIEIQGELRGGDFNDLRVVIQGAQLNGRIFLDDLEIQVDGIWTAVEDTKSKGQLLIADDMLNILDTQGDRLDIFDFMGRKIISKTINDERETYTLQKGQIYLVKIGDKVTKVAL